MRFMVDERLGARRFLVVEPLLSLNGSCGALLALESSGDASQHQPSREAGYQDGRGVDILEALSSSRPRGDAARGLAIVACQCRDARRFLVDSSPRDNNVSVGTRPEFRNRRLPMPRR